MTLNNFQIDPNRGFTSLQTVVSIDNSWSVDVDAPVIGKRIKKTLESPIDLEHGFLLRCHPYIFKSPNVGRESETLSEVLASYIGGDLLGLDIQRTYMATRATSSGNETGVLMESFLKRPYLGALPLPRFGNYTSLTHGGTIINRIYPLFDHKRGDQHSIRLIRRATSGAENRYSISHSAFVPYWARLLAFDMLINNGDRHQENWGVVPYNWQNPNEQKYYKNELGQFTPKPFYRFSPIYDNGGGFGSELDSKGLRKLVRNSNDDILATVTKYALKGRAHMGFEEVKAGSVSRKTLTFPELIKFFCDAYPIAKPIMKEISKVDLVKIEQALGFLKARAVDLGIKDCELRFNFILELIRFRRDELIQALGNE